MYAMYVYVQTSLTVRRQNAGNISSFPLRKKGRNQVELVSSDSESSDEEDFQYDSAVDDSSEDSGEDCNDESDSEITEAQALQVDDVCVNQFVLYKWMD